MSIEAINWVLNDAPDVPPQVVSTLIGIANHATPDGRNAYPSQSTLAAYSRKSERQVRRDIAELLKRGLVRRGDQRLVEHLPQDRRPVVYDLVMECHSDLDGRSSTSGRPRPPGHPRPDASDRPDIHDRTPMSERADVGDRTGGTPTSAKPSYEPSRTVPKERDAHASPSGLTAIPDDFAPTDSMRRWAVSTFGTRLDVNFETAQFCSHYRSTGARRKSWPDAWVKWMRDSDKRLSDRAARQRVAPTGGTVVPISRRQQETDAMFDRAMARAAVREETTR